MIVQEHELTVTHREGVSHQNADALSRLPLSSSYDSSGARLDHDPGGAPPSERACGGGVALALAEMAGATQEALMSDPQTADAAVAAACLQHAKGLGTSFIDNYAPTQFSQFQGHTGSLLDQGEEEPWADAPAAVEQRQRMHRKAAAWVAAAPPSSSNAT